MTTWINIISIVCMAIMAAGVIKVIYNIKRKSKAQRIAYIQSFKRGKGILLYIVSFPLFLVGFLDAGNGVFDSIFFSAKRSIELIVLGYDIEPIKATIEANGLYKAAILVSYILSAINAILFIISFSSMRLWYYSKRRKFKRSNRNKLVLFGCNSQNHTIYFNDNKRAKIVIGKSEYRNDSYSANLLYDKNILHKNEEPSPKHANKIIDECISKNREFAVVINTGNDTTNIEICRYFIDAITKLSDDNRLKCFSNLKIFTFGNPKYESIYESIVNGSYGCISYINKYRKIAIDTIEKHPFALYLGEEHVDYKTGCIKQNVRLNTLLIGFGKTNQQFFLTSVANNQFITKNSDGIEPKKVHYHLFDNDSVSSNKKLNHSYNRYAIEFANVNTNDYLPLPDQPAKTTFHKLDINDSKFYQDIREIVCNNQSVNFAVIAFGSDLENIDMAQKLVSKFREWEVKDFVIFVKVRNRCNEILFSEDDHCHIIANEDNSVYNIDNLLANNLAKMAQTRDAAYEIEKALTQSQPSAISQAKIEEIKEIVHKDWYMRKSQIDRESSAYCCLSLRSKLNLINLDYCPIEESGRTALSEEEYLAIYASNDMPDSNYYGVTADGKPIIHYTTDIKESLRKNLAVHEHLRWNSFMISKGIVPASIDKIENEVISGVHTNGKNIKLRRHGCLTTFDGLLEFRKIIAKRDLEKGLHSANAEELHDVIKYDYQLMDDAYWLLTRNGYKIVHK